CRPTSDHPLPTHQQRFPLLFVLHPLLHSLNGPRWNTVLDAFLSPGAGNGRYRGGKGAGPAGEGRGTALGKPRDRGGGEGYRSGENGEPAAAFPARSLQAGNIDGSFPSAYHPAETASDPRATRPNGGPATALVGAAQPRPEG